MLHSRRGRLRSISLQPSTRLGLKAPWRPPFTAWACWLWHGVDDGGISTRVVHGASSGSLAIGEVFAESLSEGFWDGNGTPAVDMGGVPVGLPRGATAESEWGRWFLLAVCRVHRGARSLLWEVARRVLYLFYFTRGWLLLCSWSLFDGWVCCCIGAKDAAVAQC